MTAATLVGVALSVLCEVLNHAPWSESGVIGCPSVSSLGINIILVQMVVLLWGNEPKTLRLGEDTVFKSRKHPSYQAQLAAASVAVLSLAGSTCGYGSRNLFAASGPSRKYGRDGSACYNVRRLRLLAFVFLVSWHRPPH